MPKKLTSALGVDIGSRTIKVAEVRSQGGQPMVTAIGLVDTPDGAVDHTGIYNAEAVAGALKQAIANAGASVGQVVVTIQGQSSVLVRTVEVARMSGDELKSHMEWEFSRNNPFAEANPMKDFAVLADENPGSANIDVVMAIASPHAVDTVRDSIKKAGKQAVAIDVEPLGIARSLQVTHGDEYRGQTLCVVNIGHKSTSINILRDGKLLMPRTVPVGGEQFTRAIADGLQVSVPDAETLKMTKADVASMSAAAAPAFGANPFAAPGLTQEFTPYNPFADEPMPTAPEPDAAVPSAAPVPTGDSETDRVNRALAGELDEFAAEIRRSIEYFRSRGSDVNRIVLTGGGSQLQGLAAFMGGALSIPCDAYEPLSRLNVNAKKADPAFLDAHRQEFAVAVGNGLHILF